jgi:hypothetical protein
VQRTRVTITTSINPTIDSAEPAAVTAAPNASITLVGTGLLTGDTVAQFSSGETAVPAAGSTPLRVTVTLPATLRAGVNTVRMQLPTRFEADLRAGPESNVAPFTLRPAFAPDGAGNPDIRISGQVINVQVISAVITVRLVPDVGRRQNVQLLLNEAAAAPGAVPFAYTFTAPSREGDAADTTDTIAFAVQSVRRARYLLRVRVDGAETELGMTGGSYDRPVVDLS